MSFRLANRLFDAKVVLAPMAGVTDAPFRSRCKSYGLELMITEMISSNKALMHSRGSRLKVMDDRFGGFRWVQILGGDPHDLADLAIQLEESGVDCIDINMGCPAKKVCNKAAGSALLKDEHLVESILQEVVGAVSIPVTLKTRTGWSPDHRNGPRIARIAEDCGIALLSIHGRTRACGFDGHAEYDTIAAIKETVGIPVIANGDITSMQHATDVLEQTGADAVMIGRGALGQPWKPARIDRFLRTGQMSPGPCVAEIMQGMIVHLKSLHRFYGEYQGLRIARKHLGWYLCKLDGTAQLIHRLNRAGSAQAQLDCLGEFVRPEDNS